MKAVTSIAPNPLRAESQRAYLKSWRDSGLEVVSLNHPSEIEWLAITYPEVQFVPTERTGIATFGRHYVLINAFMDWIAQQGETVMIVNADLHLEVAPGWWAQLWQRAVEGLPYLLQYNCAADGSQVLEPWGRLGVHYPPAPGAPLRRVGVVHGHAMVGLLANSGSRSRRTEALHSAVRARVSRQPSRQLEHRQLASLRE
jgi:hypothetical protein